VNRNDESKPTVFTDRQSATRVRVRGARLPDGETVTLS
jgi:hypothetical protein